MADSALSLMGLEARADQPPADYREMYLTMARAAEESLRILIEAREKCGEISFRSTEERRGIPFHLMCWFTLLGKPFVRIMEKASP